MEKSLQYAMEVQQQLYGSVGLDSFEKLLAFLRLCYTDYKPQLANDTHNIVPRYLWEDQIFPFRYYNKTDLAF